MNKSSIIKPAKEYNRKIILTVILLILFYPVGVILMWAYMKWPRWVKIIISIPLALVLIGIILPLIFLIFHPRLPSSIIYNLPLVNQKINEAHQRENVAFDSKIENDIAQLQYALELYRSDNQQYPHSLPSLVPKYIAPLPVNPLTNNSYTYQLISPDKYILSTTLSNKATYTKTSL